jgi:hypothetical protein
LTVNPPAPDSTISACAKQAAKSRTVVSLIRIL